MTIGTDEAKPVCAHAWSHQHWVTSVAISHDNRWLVSSSYGKKSTVKVWQLVGE